MNSPNAASDAADNLRKAVSMMVAGVEGLANVIEDLALRLDALETAGLTVELLAPKLMNVQQAATYLGIGKSSMYLLLSEGVIPHVVVVGKKRVDIADLNAWIDANRVDAL